MTPDRDIAAIGAALDSYYGQDAFPTKPALAALDRLEARMRDNAIIELMNVYNWAHREGRYFSQRAEDLIIAGGGLVVCGPTCPNNIVNRPPVSEEK